MKYLAKCINCGYSEPAESIKMFNDLKRDHAEQTKGHYVRILANPKKGNNARNQRT